MDYSKFLFNALCIVTAVATYRPSGYRNTYQGGRMVLKTPGGSPEMDAYDANGNRNFLRKIPISENYVPHSKNWNLNLVPDGYDEGKQKLTPILENSIIDGDNAKMNEDGVLPIYCHPPNPCPLGFTSKDGCLEDFENTAVFSREYQSKQNCVRDSEHTFDYSKADVTLDNMRGMSYDESNTRSYRRVKLAGEDILPIVAKKGLEFLR